MSDEQPEEDPMEEFFKSMKGFPLDRDALVGKVFPITEPMEVEVRQCRHCVLETADEFVAHAVNEHPLPAEPWKTSGPSGLLQQGYAVTVTAAEHRLDLMMRVADWLLGDADD